MKRAGAWACALAAGLVATSAWGATITVNGNLDDWGVNPGTPTVNTNTPWTGTPEQYSPDQNNTWEPGSGIAYTVDHFVGRRNGSNFFVDPGYGGHDVDLVSMYSMIDNNTLYLAFVTGLPLGGVADPHNRPSAQSPYYYFMGDIFINFGAAHQPSTVSNSSTLGGNHLSYAGNSWDLAFGLSAATGPNGDANLTTLTAYRDFNVDETPVGVPGYVTGPWLQNGGTATGNAVSFAYGADRYTDSANQQYHVYEFAYTLDAASLNDLQLGNWEYNVFATMNCGNDYLYLSADGDNITNTVIPVPPAAGLILLGMAGLGLRRRFARKA